MSAASADAAASVAPFLLSDSAAADLPELLLCLERDRDPDTSLLMPLLVCDSHELGSCMDGKVIACEGDAKPADWLKLLLCSAVLFQLRYLKGSKRPCWLL
jgi:hypothetical protein